MELTVVKEARILKDSCHFDIVRLRRAHCSPIIIHVNKAIRGNEALVYEIVFSVDT